MFEPRPESIVVGCQGRLRRAARCLPCAGWTTRFWLITMPGCRFLRFDEQRLHFGVPIPNTRLEPRNATFDLRGRQLVAEFGAQRSEEHTSELQSLMRISYAVFCLKKKIKTQDNTPIQMYIKLFYTAA